MPRSALLLLLAVLAVRAQVPAPASAKEEIRNPRGMPEPRRKLSKSPQEFLADLLSGNSTLCGPTLKELLDDRVNSPASQPPVVDVALRALQLDDDPDLEFILTLHLGPPPSSAVIVIDKGTDGWYCVGKFEYWWHWNPEDAARMVDIHPPYILFRSMAGGTSGSETDVWVYRLWHGELYKTFATEQIGGEENNRIVDNRVVFRTENFSPWTILEVRRNVTVTPDGQQAKPIRKRTCAGYEWVPSSFSFAVTNRATRSVCE